MLLSMRDSLTLLVSLYGPLDLPAMQISLDLSLRAALVVGLGVDVVAMIFESTH